MEETYRNYEGVEYMQIFASMKNYNNFLTKELLRFLAEDNNALDFGAGTGEFADRLQKHRKGVDCIEPDPVLFSRLANNGFKAFTELGRIETKYNKIYSLNVLEHIQDDLSTLKQLHSILTEQGKLFIYVPAMMVLYSNYDKSDGHYRRYSKAELKSKLLDSGFFVEKIKYVDSLGFLAWLTLKISNKTGSEINPRAIMIYDKYLFPLSRILDKVFKNYFGKNILVIARKL